MSKEVWYKAIILTVKFWMIVIFLWLFYQGDYLFAVQALLLVIGAFLPLLLNLKYKEPFPIELHLLWIILIAMHFFLSSFGIYKQIQFWYLDNLAHFFGGMVLATLGFYLLLALDNYKEFK